MKKHRQNDEGRSGAGPHAVKASYKRGKAETEDKGNKPANTRGATGTASRNAYRFTPLSPIPVSAINRYPALPEPQGGTGRSRSRRLYPCHDRHPDRHNPPLLKNRRIGPTEKKTATPSFFLLAPLSGQLSVAFVSLPGNLFSIPAFFSPFFRPKGVSHSVKTGH